MRVLFVLFFKMLYVLLNRNRIPVLKMYTKRTVLTRPQWSTCNRRHQHNIEKRLLITARDNRLSSHVGKHQT